MLRSTRLQAGSALFIFCVCIASANEAADLDKALGDERPSKQVDESGLVTYFSGLQLLVESKGKRVPAQYVAVGGEVIMECKAWAQKGAKISEVAFMLIDENDKPLLTAKGTRRGETKFYEAKVKMTDNPGRFRFGVALKAKPDTDAADEPEKPVRPPKPPKDSGEF
ncbi:MAG TPA: hypothetical protein VGP72_27325 [Planctomycetota bacterium]|jgi:hypothetical protein